MLGSRVLLRVRARASGARPAAAGFALALACHACSAGVPGTPTDPAGGTDAATTLTGLYLLETIDARRVDDGESTLSLSPAIRGAAPSYQYNVRVAPPNLVEADLGSWSAAGDSIAFRSATGAGSYAGVTRVDAPSGRVSLELVGRGGQRFAFRRVRPSGGADAGAAGTLIVAVVDGAGRQVRGAEFALRAPDGVVTRGASTEFGPFGLSGPAGEWRVTTTPPAGYAFAEGQANPKSVLVRAGQVDTVRVGLIASGQ